jgi:hypothetical protein
MQGRGVRDKSALIFQPLMVSGVTTDENAQLVLYRDIGG